MQIQESCRRTEHVESQIAARLRTLITERCAQAGVHGADFETLWRTTATCIEGGKLLRPRLLVGTYHGFTAHPAHTASAGVTDDSVLQLGVALELLHFAFLLHDDVIDEDMFRRGAPNLIGKLRNQPPHPDHAAAPDAQAQRTRWAQSGAILVGDLMLTIAHQLFARAPMPDPLRIRTLDLLDDTITETVAGEYCDVGLAAGHITPDIDTVLTMTQKKTATYTVEFPLRLAAILAGAPPEKEQLLGDIGRHLGTAFQLQDDHLSAFGAHHEHGKDPFSDFREGKVTALIAYARGCPEWAQIAPLIGSPNFSHNSGVRIQELLEVTGAKHAVETHIDAHLHHAHTLLTHPALADDDAVQHFLRRMIDTLESRRA